MLTGSDHGAVNSRSGLNPTPAEQRIQSALRRSSLWAHDGENLASVITFETFELSIHSRTHTEDTYRGRLIGHTFPHQLKERGRSCPSRRTIRASARRFFPMP